MEKLELKHLAPYLPYGLKGINSFGNQIEIHAHHYLMDGRFIGLHPKCKPILHPLSEYCGEITGGDVKNKLNCKLSNVHEIWDLFSHDISLDEVSYGTYLVMCKNHIDFNGLIEKGLAISYNEIEQ